MFGMDSFNVKDIPNLVLGFHASKIHFLGILSNIQRLYIVHDNINVAFGMFTTQVYDSGEFPYSIR